MSTQESTTESTPTETIETTTTGPVPTDEGQTNAPAQSPQIQLQIDDNDTPSIYSTTSRVWGSSEEINVDFAGPIRPGNGPKTAKLKIDQRVVLNPYAAKRLALALAQSVQRYEKAYGAIELDEKKRRK